ncbi:MAG: hypothetical protein A3K41_16095 [Chloroflexi bacterium RIFOXYD12_FULL_57_15]|nr:MAG: hypothetical protein A3K41_16095 [Chloroflexi bacterium RIFOXYD12_FULL_57_15]
MIENKPPQSSLNPPSLPSRSTLWVVSFVFKNVNFNFSTVQTLNANTANGRMTRISFIFIREIRSFATFALKMAGD